MAKNWMIPAGTNVLVRTPAGRVVGHVTKADIDADAVTWGVDIGTGRQVADNFHFGFIDRDGYRVIFSTLKLRDVSPDPNACPHCGSDRCEYVVAGADCPVVDAENMREWVAAQAERRENEERAAGDEEEMNRIVAEGERRADAIAYAAKHAMPGR